jgi:hypothetical protein
MKYQVARILHARTPDGILTILPGKIVRLRPDKADYLVELGKVVPLSHQPQSLFKYRDLFGQALAGIVPLDQHGELVRRIWQDMPPTWSAIQSAEDEINVLWHLALDGKEVWNEYVAAVEKWKAIFIQAIQRAR